MRTERLASQRGVTLIELMVALVVTSIAIAAAFGIAYTMIDSYRGHQRSMALEQAARASLDIIADSLRGASPGVLTGKIDDLASCSSEESSIVVANDVGWEDSDALGVMHASGGVLTWLSTGFDCSTGTCPATMTVEDANELVAGDLIIVTNFDQGYIFRVGTVGGNVLTLDIGCPPENLASFPPGALVMRARMSVFSINHSFGVPVLMIDPDGGSGPMPREPVAEGIEDLQIAIAWDRDGDGEITENGASAGDDEWFYNVAGEWGPPLLENATPPWRAIRITVVARSTRESGGVADSFRPTVEDHPGSTSPDVFKRRTLSTTVELRNLQGSP